MSMRVVTKQWTSRKVVVVVMFLPFIRAGPLQLVGYLILWFVNIVVRIIVANHTHLMLIVNVE